MNPYLSIIITSHNDAEETVRTIQSLKSTLTPDDLVEILLIDDCSATPLASYMSIIGDGVKLITNTFRCGCGPSRHIGALHASGYWLLLVDSHMRFTPGWYQAWEETVAPAQRPGDSCPLAHTVWCATCLGLDSKHMDVRAPASVYHGATMNFLGPDRNPPHKEQIFEAVWLPKSQEPEDLQEIPVVMGACYFIPRNWFLHLAPTRFLRTWGCDEQMISLKTWLAGGCVRMAKNVRIGHKFLTGTEKQPWGCPVGHVLWNKLFAINTLFPFELCKKLTERILAGNQTPDLEAARRLFKTDFYLVGQEWAFNRSIFTRSVEEYAKKFNIQLP